MRSCLVLTTRPGEPPGATCRPLWGDVVGCGPPSGNWVSLKMMLSASQKRAQVVGNLGQRRGTSKLATWEAVPAPRSVILSRSSWLRLFGSGELVFVLRLSGSSMEKRGIRVLGSSRMPWGLPGGGVEEQVGVLLCKMRAPKGLSGALFARRDTHTLPMIWAGSLTSTEKVFFQGCLAANCWVDWRPAQMKEKPSKTLPPRGAGPTSGPRPCPRPASSAPRGPLGRHNPHPCR